MVRQDADRVRAHSEHLGSEEDGLAVLGLLLGQEVRRLGLAVDVERLVAQLDDVSGEADETLDERHAAAVRIAHDDDVAATGVPLPKRRMRENGTRIW